MKKTLIVNIIIVVLFLVFDPLLNFCGELADTYSLGGEMVLGMIVPVIFVMFVTVVLCSTIYSIYKSIANKDIKYFFPVLVFVVGIIVYMFISNSESFWIRLISYYMNQ